MLFVPFGVGARLYDELKEFKTLEFDERHTAFDVHNSFITKLRSILRNVT